MQPTSRKVLLSLLFLVVWLPDVSAETLTVALIEYPPYEGKPSKVNGRWGYMPEVIQEIYQKQGIEVTFELVPWKRALIETEKGVYDAIPLVNAGHTKRLLFSQEKTAVLRQMFFVKRGTTWRYAGLSSLESITIGWVLGYDYSTFSREYQEYIEKHRGDKGRVIYTAGDTASADMFRRILSGSVTTFNEDQTFFRYIMSQGGIGRLEDFETAGTLGNNDQYMGFSPVNPQSPRYVSLFDRGIKALRESGRLKSILDSYGISDWQHDVDD